MSAQPADDESPRGGHNDAQRAWRERNAERVADYRRDYNDAHRDEIREKKREWRQRNADHIAEYRREYNEEHRDEIRVKNREYMRAQATKQKARDAAAERRRVYSREYYAKNRARYLDQQRQRRAARRAADPDAYRAQAQARNKRWRDAHLERENAKLRAAYAANPEPLREKARQYYTQHREHVLEQRRASYAASPDRREQQRESRARDKAQRELAHRLRASEGRRRVLGMPTSRLHPSTADERHANDIAADDFFARRYSRAEKHHLRTGGPTPPELLEEWKRDCARARAVAYLVFSPDIRDRMRVAERDRIERQDARYARQLRHQAQIEEEDRRMDAIATEINRRLRVSRPPRRTGPDFAAPHQPGVGDTSGPSIG
ncbi:MAG: hypothetical protein ACTHNQ_19470 [Microbacterium sp.]|uniref:hypothetical protein n=1 Tax=Microbacterium sp. TaxID=51671 RepID=UPI003F7FF214